MTLTFRSFKPKDIADIHQLVYETWYETKDDPNSTITKALAQFYVNDCLHGSNYGQVAIIKNKVTGVILGNVHANGNSLGALATSGLNELFQFSKTPIDQTQLISSLKTEKELNESMLGESKEEYDAEIRLFLIDKQFQGQGVDSQLLTNLLNHFNEQAVKKYYLFTDDACNIEFYDYKGLKKIKRRTHPHDNSSSPFQYYMYDGLVE